MVYTSGLSIVGLPLDNVSKAESKTLIRLDRKSALTYYSNVFPDILDEEDTKSYYTKQPNNCVHIDSPSLVNLVRPWKTKV